MEVPHMSQEMAMLDTAGGTPLPTHGAKRAGENDGNDKMASLSVRK